jgi:formylglycine-generating enzyme required for sulfatase activity
MKVVNCSAIFRRGSRLGFWLLALLISSAIAAWRVDTAASVAAQAKTKANPRDGLTYVWIPPGTFQMGCSPNDSECNRNETPHSVRLTKGFWIGQTPVTQAAYKKVVGSNPSAFKGDQLPVETVSWDDAQAYCKAVAMRLPTEAEWEYAARGGSPAARYAPLAQVAWYSANSDATTHEVGKKQANAYGLYDTLGNVWEWVADWYGPYEGASAVDPKGPRTGRLRMLRGASFGLDASFVRVSYRSWYDPGYHSYGDGYVNGFRCAGN